MAYVALSAPCNEGDAVMLAHAGVRVDLEIPPGGRLAATLPVLDGSGVIAASLASGARVAADAPAPSARTFDHVVLQWQGSTGLQLHALENGAEYDGPGHVWAGAPKEALRSMRGEGGFLTRLGNSKLGGVAEIYTHPVGAMHGSGAVTLTVEVEVTPENCGRDITGEVLQRAPDGAVESAEITFAMPGCDAVGDILVLKNILQDMKIAGN